MTQPSSETPGEGAKPRTTASPSLPPTPPAPAGLPARRKKEPQQSNVKETLEQILVAFILAFIFRCFIVEAYVIPTGSMAPTLLGAHMNFRCPDCGWRWTVNYSGENGGEDVPAQASEVYPIRCSNCGFKLPRDLPGEPENDATAPPVAYGDRILVQKYIYLLHEPRRWDVVVFKTPFDNDPRVEDYTQNYIKRLIGTPGETVMILDGDVYVAQDKPNLADYKPEDFAIQSKPYKVQEAMWRVVYDNDYLPRGLTRTYAPPANQYTAGQQTPLVDYPFVQPWKPTGDGWNVDGRTFTFKAATTGRIAFDAEEMPEKHSLTDWVGYDVSHMTGKKTDSFLDRGYDSSGFGDRRELERRGYRLRSGIDPLNNVSDVKLMFSYRRKSGDGALHANITKHRNLFQLELVRGKASLKRFAPGATTPQEIGSVEVGEPSIPLRVEFAVVDYRASVRINGKEVIASTPEQFSPDVAALLADNESRTPQPRASISIDAYAQECELSHVSLWRDVYYITRDARFDVRAPLRWAMPHGFPGGTSTSQLMQLGKDEFFVMGDNSMLSSDARIWPDPVMLSYEDVDVQGGRVPRRFMLGRAFFVYWPAGYTPVNGFLRFVPNFGEMRFIH